ncbi:hypothetical protein AB835_02790 [Candidatus Endobugula sertula]|uniref:Uncharacterized protein n=1 Tax=Candidatus Endobugula sertula TaxID=62101 RepID=A0A1D2QSK4_9GAMM|nr:hypothetical protein AB835_02790 [Candidatus Endobugula sertula]
MADDVVTQDGAGDNHTHYRIRDFVIDNTSTNDQADVLDISDLLSGSSIELDNLGDHLHVISSVYSNHRSGIFVNRDGQFTEEERTALTENPSEGGQGADIFLEFQGYAGNNNFEDITGFADNTVEQLQALIDMGFLEVS